MPVHRLAVVAAASLLALSAHAQTFYRCQDGNKVTYSDRPCVVGTEKRIRADGRPTAEEIAASRARLQRELDQRAASEALMRERQRADAEAAAQKGAAPAAITAPSDPRDNEKVMVHSESGWDYKTRGQLEAERAAREGRPVRSSGAAWEGEKITTLGPAGWETSTRLEAAKAEGERQRRHDDSIVIINGEPFARAGPHGVVRLQDGKYCPLAGNVAVCS